MSKVITKIGAILASALLIGTWFVAPAISGSGRDCDNNAVIKCGALTTTELYQKLRDGGSGPHQSSAELRALFMKYGIYTSEFGNLRGGYVTKSGNVVVGGKTVATNVLSMGRHYMSGSTQVAGISYPLYLRHPSVSFVSNSIDAFVMLNPDGSFRYAVLKSCANIVIPSSAPTPKYTLRVHKFIDANEDSHFNAGEKPQGGVSFTLHYPAGNTHTDKTNASGDVVFGNLAKGKYTIKEWVPAGYRNTTVNPRTITVDGNETQYFGNAPLNRELRIVKFIDANEDSHFNAGEGVQAGVTFRVTGSGIDRTQVTGGDGRTNFSNLPQGQYTITETVPEGYRNTTVNPRTITLTGSDTQYFGNARKPVIIKELRGGLRIEKYNDANGNRSRDAGEPMLNGWSFRVTGPNGYDNTVTTAGSGIVTVPDLVAGNYTITENLIAGWDNTTGLTQNATVRDDETAVVTFGNRAEVPEGRGNILIQKYEDANGNRTQDSGENSLSGWTFRVVGPGFEREVVTDAGGTSLITGLAPGRYIVTEINQDGWINTTGLVVTEDLTAGETQTYIFGNRKTTPGGRETPGGGGEVTSLPVSGPMETAAATGGAMTFSGAILAWIRSKRNLLDAIRRK